MSPRLRAGEGYADVGAVSAVVISRLESHFILLFPLHPQNPYTLTLSIMGEEGSGRSCGITRDLQKLKQQAMAYYQENDVPRRLEELLNATFYLQPADVYGHLAIL